MTNPRYLWLGLAALGLATGFAIPKKDRAEAGADAMENEVRPAKVSRDGLKETASKMAASLGTLPISKDSIEDLLALDASDLYGRVGLWLLDASAEDMAAFWTAYHARGNVNSWVKDLVFTQWAKKDVKGLLEAAKRTNEEGPAWWAWTMSDPDAALAAMEGQPDEIRVLVLRGIGNFHPKRALKMMEEDPELTKHFNLATLAAELGKNDPQAAVEFMAKRGSYELYKPLRKWAKEDPRRAFEWLIERDRDAGLQKHFVDVVSQEDPEILSDLTAGMPSGAIKREFESEVFKRLVTSDPEKALEDARKTEAVPLQAQRLAQVGKTMVSEKPEQALEILEEILKVCPDASTRMKWTRYPNGGSGGGGGVAGVNEFIGELAHWNPQLVMESVREAEGETKSGGGPMDERTGAWHVANTWIAKDGDGFAAWCEQQDENTFTFGATTYASYLSNKEDFLGATEWAQRIKDPKGQASALMLSVSRWTSRDREAATQWFEQADLPDEVRTRIKPYFEKRSK